jgi:hypothetical protein
MFSAFYIMFSAFFMMFSAVFAQRPRRDPSDQHPDHVVQAAAQPGRVHQEPE